MDKRHPRGRQRTSKGAPPSRTTALVCTFCSFLRYSCWDRDRRTRGASSFFPSEARSTGPSTSPSIVQVDVRVGRVLTVCEKGSSEPCGAPRGHVSQRKNCWRLIPFAKISNPRADAQRSIARRAAFLRFFPPHGSVSTVLFFRNLHYPKCNPHPWQKRVAENLESCGSSLPSGSGVQNIFFHLKNKPFSSGFLTRKTVSHA